MVAPIDLTFHHAAVQWRTVEELEQETYATSERLRKQRHALNWAEPLQRSQVETAIASGEEALVDVTRRTHAARRRALLLSSRAAQRAWGVQLGREYSFIDRHGNPRTQLTVDFLRPVQDLSPGETAVFVCGGPTSHGRERELFILGRDVQVANDTENSNVIHLTALLPSRR